MLMKKQFFLFATAAIRTKKVYSSFSMKIVVRETNSFLTNILFQTIPEKIGVKQLKFIQTKIITNVKLLPQC